MPRCVDSRGHHDQSGLSGLRGCEKVVALKLDKSNRCLIHGGLLVPKKTKANHFVTPHGGVALTAKKGFIRSFTVEEDMTGLWKDLSLSTRVTAAWVQIMPKIRALIFSFYGETSKHDNSYLRVNNFMLEKVFAIASQFGEIPIMLCGDFQAEPDEYSAIVAAKRFGKWCDPLCATDSLGNPTGQSPFLGMPNSAIQVNTIFHLLMPFFSIMLLPLLLFRLRWIIPKQNNMHPLLQNSRGQKLWLKGLF